MKKKKILIFIILLITIPVVKGEVQLPLTISIRGLQLFLLEIGQFWIEHIEKLIGPIVGIV